MKDPAVLFYTQDFIVGTNTMNFEDRGKYITLLCQMHQEGRLSEETIRFLVGSVSDRLRLKFSIDEKGLWYNERLEQEIEKRLNFVDSRRKNGKKGGRPKASGKPIGKPNAKANKNLSEDENENENESLNEDENTIVTVWPTFEDFWDLYDKKVGMKDSRKIFDGFSQEVKEKIMAHVEEYKISQPDKQFRKNPKTYLNQKGWEDEIIYKKQKNEQQDTGVQAFLRANRN